MCGGVLSLQLLSKPKTISEYKVKNTYIEPQLIMEDSHKNNTSETAPQSGSTVQGAHISHIRQQPCG